MFLLSVAGSAHLDSHGSLMIVPLAVLTDEFFTGRCHAHFREVPELRGAYPLAFGFQRQLTVTVPILHFALAGNRNCGACSSMKSNDHSAMLRMP